VDPRRRRVLLVILSTTLSGIMGNTLLAPAIPDILDDFGVSDGGAGVLIAATALPGVFLAPVIGVLADRFGRRPLLVPCLAVFGLSGLGAAAAPTFTLLVVARFGMGIGAAGLINLAVVLIGDHWEGDDRTRLVGRNAAFLTTCVAILPLVGGALTDLAGWRVALLPYGLALVFAAFAWRTLEPGRPDTDASLRDQLRALGPVLRRPDLLAVFASGVTVFVLVFGAFLAAIPLHLEDEFGFGATIRGLFLALPALPSTIAAFNLQRLRAGLGTQRLLVVSGAMITIGFVLMGTAHVALLLALGAVVYGFGEGVVIPSLQNIAVSTPARYRGTVVAVFVSSTRLGQTVGPLAAAALFEATSTFTALQVGAVLGVGLTALFVLGPFERSAERSEAAAPAS
jgi:ACDE family multidrug resistance protein